MIRIAGYLRHYFTHLNKSSFAGISLFISILIAVNYYFSLNDRLTAPEGLYARFAGFALLYLSVYASAWLLVIASSKSRGSTIKASIGFWLLVAAAGVIFGLKTALSSSDIPLGFLGDGEAARFYGIVLQWPVKAIAVLACLLVIGWAGRYRQPYFGLSLSGAGLGPYWLLLAGMLPLVLFAGLQPDFQSVYPKLQRIGEEPGWLKSIVFELSYGIDFFTIELFFRGFLIVAFIKYAGNKVVLPMAAFYCAIHFGKPMLECISSYFGGIILGAIVLNTRSIWGGLVVHLGIAWSMELVGIFL